MAALTAVLQVGTEPPLGGGLRPAVVAHCYEGGLPRFVAYAVESDGPGGPTLDRYPGGYAPDLDAEPAYPVTDLLLATHREGSAIAQRLDVLSEKARANYGRSFTEMVFESDVEWGADGFGRLFEARSQLEAHPYEATVAVGFLPGAGESVRTAVGANLDRIDGQTRTLRGSPSGPGSGGTR